MKKVNDKVKKILNIKNKEYVSPGNLLSKLDYKVTST